MDTAELMLYNRASRRVIGISVALFLLLAAADWFLAGKIAGILVHREIADLLAVSGGGTFTAAPDPEAVLAGEKIYAAFGISGDMQPQLMDSFGEYRKILFLVMLVLGLLGILLFAGIYLYELNRIYRQLENLRYECCAAADALQNRVSEAGEEFESIHRVCEAVNRMAGQLVLIRNTLSMERSFQKDFLTDFSHQLKTSLAVVRLDSDMLLETSLSLEKQEQLSEEISLHLDSMEKMVISALRLAKINADAVVYEKSAENLTETCQEAIKRVLPILRKRNISVSISKDAVCFPHDRMWLCEAMENLLKNAADHGNCTEISVKLANLSGAAKLTVSDNGTGISQKEIPHLFERFYQKDHGTEQNFGVGLAIAKKVVEAHNGTITVYSGIGKGTSFEIIFLK